MWPPLHPDHTNKDQRVTNISGFSAVPNNGRLPDDFEDLRGARNDSAREKRRYREHQKQPTIKVCIK